MLIRRLSYVEELEALEQDFAHRVGVKPYNISSWHVSSEFQKTALSTLSLPIECDWINYQYTYGIEAKAVDEVKRKIGILQKDMRNISALFYPNNTIAIVNIANYVYKTGLKRIVILNPAYFSILQALNYQEVQCIEIPMAKDNEQNWQIPYAQIIAQNPDAVWITSPIYSTGIYYSEENIHEIEQLQNHGLQLIFDESFCLPGEELYRRMSSFENCISILSPHKAICINGLKFSIVLCDAEQLDFLEQWNDVYSGNLPPSSICAIYHYLGQNYDDCVTTFTNFTNASRSSLFFLLNGCERACCHSNSKGSLLTLFYPRFTCQDFQSFDFITKLMNSTYALFYPGSLNGFPDESEACFRVNLALDSPEFRGAVNRVLQFLDAC